MKFYYYTATYKYKKTQLSKKHPSKQKLKRFYSKNVVSVHGTSTSSSEK